MIIYYYLKDISTLMNWLFLISTVLVVLNFSTYKSCIGWLFFVLHNDILLHWFCISFWTIQLISTVDCSDDTWLLFDRTLHKHWWIQSLSWLYWWFSQFAYFFALSNLMFRLDTNATMDMSPLMGNLCILFQLSKCNNHTPIFIA